MLFRFRHLFSCALRLGVAVALCVTVHQDYAAACKDKALDVGAQMRQRRQLCIAGHKAKAFEIPQVHVPLDEQSGP